jgi:hypothetical protein
VPLSISCQVRSVIGAVGYAVGGGSKGWQWWVVGVRGVAWGGCVGVAKSGGNMS